MNSSYFSGIILDKCLVPEHHRPLTQVIIVPDCFALFSDAFLCTVFELFTLFVAGGIQDALQKHFFVLITARFVFHS